MRDPVCGMTVGDTAPKVDEYPEYGFCSEGCSRAFRDDPARYYGDTHPEASSTVGSTSAGASPEVGS